MARIFISYAREEVPFISPLVTQLKLAQHEVWIDYQSLVPGKPWSEQLYEGIAEAELALLVVSKASMASPYVKEEIEFLQQSGKRILLLIFEAVPLPENALSLEWIDFRTKYRNATIKLLERIEQPAPPKKLPPQRGFNMPILAWVFFFFSLSLPVLSLFAAWTIFLPVLLIPLPIRILKRDYNYYKIRSALFFLPISILLTTVYFPIPIESPNHIIITLAFILSLMLGALLLIFMHLPIVQSWGQSITNRPKRQLTKEILEISKIKRSFYIEAAPEDSKIANAIEHTLTSHGHTYQPDQSLSEIDFVLISTYKQNTALDPERNMIIPMLIQSTPNITETLSRIQWIDFRLGVRHLKKIGDLLGEPEKMLSGLGIKPFNEQVVHPPIVEYLNSMHLLTIFSLLTSWGYICIKHWDALCNAAIRHTGAFFFILIGQILISHLAWQHLKKRRGFLSKLPGQIIALISPLISNFILAIISGRFIFPDFFTDEQFYITLFPLYLMAILFIVLIGYLLFYARDLWRWLPQTVKLPGRDQD